MCGIFGYNSVRQANKKAKTIVDELFLLSESRGKEASGCVLNDGNNINYFKAPIPASELIQLPIYKKQFSNFLNSKENYRSVIGHSRLVTNGSEDNSQNNQPVVKDDLILIHNGIVVNYEQLWGEISAEPIPELDTEVIPELIYHYKKESNYLDSVVKTMNAIKGMTSIALMNSTSNDLVLATNNGSIYYVFNDDNSEFIFASEKLFLTKLIEKLKLTTFKLSTINQLLPKSILILDQQSNQYNRLEYSHENTDPFEKQEVVKKTINKIEIGDNKAKFNKSLKKVEASIPLHFKNTYQERKLKVNELKRCTKCILPSTFPFIEFDQQGVCNYCNHYTKLSFKGEDKIILEFDKYRSNKPKVPDCLVPFSGGRDSSYVLHYLKKEMGMNPIAFSYDWGMITDIARRNQARMCGELGVEHILISADIRKKRKNIQKNVIAWLKRPHLGTIPLFMAGDKQYFYYTNLLMKENNLSLSVMGENMLETTRFKTGFCGIEPNFSSEHTYSLKMKDKMKMLSFYGKEFLVNPSYINTSLIDSLGAFKSYYMMNHESINLFDYLKWDEHLVDDTLINTYNWETDPESKTTWRIGDGTAAFYNYIYYMIAGFTENDTFRSNQIREGVLSREEALIKVELENAPRWNSIQWYCNTIDINSEHTINLINKIKTLF